MAESVAAPIADYDRLLAERHYASTVEGLATAHRVHAMSYPDGRRWCATLRPAMVHRDVYDRATAAARTVSAALRELTERVLADRRLRAALGFPRYLDPALDIDRELGNASLLARLDGFIVGDGVRFIEYNAEPGGLASSREVEQAFADLPIAADFARVHPYSTFDNVALAFGALWRDHARHGGERAPALAVLRTTASMVQSAMLRWLPDAAARGCRVFIVRPEEIDAANDGLRVEGNRIDYLVFADWGSVFEPAEPMRRVLRSVAQGTVRTLNGVSRVVAGTSKALLEALTSRAYAHLFDGDTVRALAAHVPWTRWLREARTDFDGNEIELMRFAEDHRETLVLKPANGKSGQGLVVGVECDDAAWRAALAAAARRPSVVQQRIEAPRQAFPVSGSRGELCRDDLRWDFNPYVWNGDIAAGALVRAGTDANLSAGTGSVVPLWVIER